MNGKTILLVEDNTDVQDFNRFLLEKQGFAVETAATLSAAREIVARRMPDAVVLDIGMPDGSGLGFLRELRRASGVPVLILTGYKKDDDVVQGFHFGCDDYLAKPYTFEVLNARLSRLLQSSKHVPERVTCGPLTIEILSGQAFLRGVDLLLAQKELALLLLFVQHEGRMLDADYLYKNVWGQGLNDNTSALKTMIYRLRKKLEGSGYDILARRGQGYIFEIEESAK